jgi:hypothetical protein
VLEWDEQGEQIVVRRAGTYSSEDVHHAIFRKPPKANTIEQMKEGVGRYMKKRHARR